jgi:hypothetical protein
MVCVGGIPQRESTLTSNSAPIICVFASHRLSRGHQEKHPADMVWFKGQRKVEAARRNDVAKL